MPSKDSCFQKITKKFFSLYGSPLRFGGLLCLTLLGFALFDPTAITFADDTGLGGFPNSSEEMTKNLGTILSLIVRILSFISMFVISVGAELMSTELILGDNAMEGIKLLWRFVLNVTNIGFVLVLLYLAFANMFLSGDGDWSIKAKLPKIILALVAINFSLLFFRVAVQVVDVGTVAILSIADDKVNAKDIKELLETPVSDITTKDDTPIPFYKVFNKAMNCNVDGNSIGSKGDDCLFFIDPSKNTNQTTRNIMVAFAVNFLDLEQMPALSVKLGKISSVVDSVLFSAIISIAYVMALLAMFFVMLFRVAALWFFMVFSPLIVAGLALGIGGGSGGGVGQKLITYLLVPLKIAAVFTLSFVMTGAMVEHTAVYSGNFLQMGTALKDFGGGADGNLFNILWKILTVAIFWKGAFMAMDGTEAEPIVKGIESATTSVGSYALKTATVDRPLFSVGQSGDKVSASSLLNVTGRLPSIRTSKLGEETNSVLSALRLGNTPSNQNYQKTSDDLGKKAKSLETETDREGLKSIFKDIHFKGMVANEELIRRFVNSLERGGNLQLVSQEKSKDDFINNLKSRDEASFKDYFDSQALGNIKFAENSSDKPQNSNNNLNPDANTIGNISFSREAPNATVEFTGSNDKLEIKAIYNGGDKVKKVNLGFDKDLATSLKGEDFKLLVEKSFGNDANPEDYTIKKEGVSWVLEK